MNAVSGLPTRMGITILSYDTLFRHQPSHESPVPTRLWDRGPMQVAFLLFYAICVRHATKKRGMGAALALALG